MRCHHARQNGILCLKDIFYFWSFPVDIFGPYFTVDKGERLNYFRYLQLLCLTWTWPLSVCEWGSPFPGPIWRGDGGVALVIFQYHGTYMEPPSVCRAALGPARLILVSWGSGSIRQRVSRQAHRLRLHAPEPTGSQSPRAHSPA